jgi:hypothetical protein
VSIRIEVPELDAELRRSRVGVAVRASDDRVELDLQVALGAADRDADGLLCGRLHLADQQHAGAAEVVGLAGLFAVDRADRRRQSRQEPRRAAAVIGVGDHHL